jgi:hypothetical protein
MKITVNVSKEAINLVKAIAKEVSGKNPSKEQLEKFFSEDIAGLYSDVFEDNIEDAVESFFGR